MKLLTSIRAAYFKLKREVSIPPYLVAQRCVRHENGTLLMTMFDETSYRRFILSVAVSQTAARKFIEDSCLRYTVDAI